ncbi:hypothetical protein HPP92_012615 [Vanilla planifolia]|uniref:J domain-containing protein n=1 Tax=Vanilla planifolia TaxID=51239 RepID=A0A835UZU4_VANPL|nr:hypothetical protein HPP92_012615 [Vanilla planifolia]
MSSCRVKEGDLYAVLGVEKDCSEAELRHAYKKLAMRWHPDRCSASGKSDSVDEAKRMFQSIQEAYSILSDSNKRFLYDVGVYDSDDGENGMGEFLEEMARMMRETNSSVNKQESFDELRQLFDEMFQPDVDLDEQQSAAASAVRKAASSSTDGFSINETDECGGGLGGEKCSSSAGFCFGTNEGRRRSSGGRRKQKGKKTQNA